MIVGIHGAIGSGKSTAADILCRLYGFELMSFADPLKRALRMWGWPSENLWGPSSQRERTDNAPFGVSARSALQTLGTDWGRNMIHEDIWVSLALRDARASSFDVVFSDVRFDSEARGCDLVIELVGRAGARGPAHASEAGVSSWLIHHTISNHGSLSDLEDALVSIIGRGAP